MRVGIGWTIFAAAMLASLITLADHSMSSLPVSESALHQVRPGMSHHEVAQVLGPPAYQYSTQSWRYASYGIWTFVDINFDPTGTVTHIQIDR